MILNTISAFFVLSGVIGAIVIFADQYLQGNRHQMKIMDTVWILTGLWAGVFGLLAYYSFGRQQARHKSSQIVGKIDRMKGMSTMENIPEMKGVKSMDQMSDMSNMSGMDMPAMKSMNARPGWQNTTLSTLHCGAGCSLADLIGEYIVLLIPMSIIAGWTLDYILALAIGIMFQYSVIFSMEKLSRKKAYAKAFKVDFWSLTAWQVGMYAFLAIVIFGFGFHVDRLSWEFWFMMQIAMMCGFLTSYPMNRLLLKLGIKKEM